MIVTTTLSRVTVWSRQTKAVLQVIPQTSANCAIFSKNVPPTYIAITSSNSNIEIFSAVYPFASIQTFGAGLGGVSAPNIDIFGTFLVACGGNNNKIKIWDISSNPPSITLDAALSQSRICTFSTATQLAVATSNGNLNIITVTSSNSYSTAMTTSIAGCSSISFSPTSNLITAACTAAGSTGVHVQVPSGTITNIITAGSMLATSYAKDGNYFCFGGSNNYLYIVSSNKTIISQFL